ncbi:alpha/beta fold hydrolase [Pseudoxanthomonas sp.]|uniref:esterase/lipase family protein n=1 Tax=Pseudoxanthomonas sp. TaxID=1871049 RepID=UPI002601D969|nr:alpha/beta fold hydrolase [Pseudoxanthomonas sp.]WDS35821.1 MAG: alpha/beta fold hydrolase [Pseudoxanthomonas sp.]
MKTSALMPRFVRVLALAVLLLLTSCAMVTVETRKQHDYIAQVRGDVLTTGKLSTAAGEVLQVAGLDAKTCQRALPECTQQFQDMPGISAERRMATLAELWTGRALAVTPRDRAATDDAALGAWLTAARYAYAYLFFTERAPGERAFVNRQTQVRDYYNYATEQIGEGLFRRFGQAGSDAIRRAPMLVADWTLQVDMADFRLPGDVAVPDRLMSAAAVRFNGLRSTYRRDGFGAELVARVPPQVVGDPTALVEGGLGRHDKDTPAFSEIPYVPATLLLDFRGDDLATVLSSRQAVLHPYDPYRTQKVTLHGDEVPLAGNFTTAYGLWLAQSGFARQSLRSMLGRTEGIDRPHLYLMQPYDPNRRILLMLHGLASSPEAWVNVANEIMGDEALRQHYQIWQVYYPTNVPIAINRAQIHDLVEQTLQHFDPQGSAPASQDMVLIGHSMGGVIGRLLLTSSGEGLFDVLMADRRMDEARRQRVRERLQPLLHFSPLPQVDRAIFIAAPIRGTPMAESRLGRFVGRLVRLPITLLEKFGDVLQDMTGQDDGQPDGKHAVPNAIDNLRDTDPFIRATSALPIASGVRYNTIIARKDPKVPLEQSDDGLVPYASAHLDGAESEKVITSWHSVQETPQAILEIRRILHAQMEDETAGR